jgi:hypothetical protein
MADIFQGSVAPDVNTSRTTGSVAPQYYTDYLTDIAQAGSTALSKPADQMVAPLTALQEQGYGAIPGAAESYKPGLGAAQETAGMAAQGITPEAIQSFMNPYTTNVVDEMARLQQQNVQRNLMPTLKAGFVGTGGLGGQRYANALGQTSADLQSNLTGQQYGALSAGYKDAMTNAYNQASLQNQVAQTQGTLAGQEQALGLTGAGAMTKGGAEQQAYQQSLIDAPLKTAANTAALMKGYTVPTTTTETFKGPMAGVYGASPLSQLTGLGALVGSGLSGTTYTTIDAKGNPVTRETPGWLKDLLGSGAGLVKDWYNSSSNSSNTTDYGGGGGEYNNSIVNPVTDSSGLPTGTGTENMNSSI